MKLTQTTAVAAVVLPILLATWLSTAAEQSLQFTLAGYTLTPLLIDDLSRWFAVLFCVALSAASLFCFGRVRPVEILAALGYGLSAIAVVLAGDLLSALLFWELMAVFSALLIWSAATPEAYQASMRYIAIHLVGGVLMMTGIAGYASLGAGLELRSLTGDPSTAATLILVAILINAAAWPLSAWAPDAYPSASVYGTVFLSAFTTKTAVYLLLRLYPGETLLLFAGAAMIIYGVLYALRESRLRPLLIYSLVAQVGYMVMSIGSGDPTATSAVSLHAFAHVTYKMLLLMVAAVVITAHGTEQLAELAGSVRRQPLLIAGLLVGALSLAGMPLSTAFLSKSLMSDALHSAPAWTSSLLSVAAILAVVYVGLRLPWLLLIQAPSKQTDSRPAQPLGAGMTLAIASLVALCLLPALTPVLAPGLLAGALPGSAAIEYSSAGVLKQLLLLTIGAVAFITTRRFLLTGRGGTVDSDWLYRDLAPRIGRALVDYVRRLHADINTSFVHGLLPRLLAAIEALHDPDGVFGKSWSTSVMAVWIAALLAFYTLSYFV